LLLASARDCSHFTSLLDQALGGDRAGQCSIRINDQYRLCFTWHENETASELMGLWRLARDQGAVLPPEQQAELDSLVEAELRAATARTDAARECMNLYYVKTAERSKHCCEYCQSLEVAFNSPFEIGYADEPKAFR
jgi:hypothetical protein